MKYTKFDHRRIEERKIITNFFTPISMTSIWDRPELQSEEQDYSNSKFLSKRLSDGQSMTVKFLDVLHKEQPENTPEQFKTPDNKQFIFYFDSDGRELEFAQNSPRGKFFSAMRAAEIEPETLVTITRRGIGMETKWEIVRAGEQPLAPNEEIKF